MKRGGGPGVAAARPRRPQEALIQAISSFYCLVFCYEIIIKVREERAMEGIGSGSGKNGRHLLSPAPWTLSSQAASSPSELYFDCQLRNIKSRSIPLGGGRQCEIRECSLRPIAPESRSKLFKIRDIYDVVTNMEIVARLGSGRVRGNAAEQRGVTETVTLSQEQIFKRRIFAHTRR